MCPDANVERVRHQLYVRALAGINKYGVTTERKDLSTKEWLQHLQEELLDAAVYIERLKQDVAKLVALGAEVEERRRSSDTKGSDLL